MLLHTLLKSKTRYVDTPIIELNRSIPTKPNTTTNAIKIIMCIQLDLSIFNLQNSKSTVYEHGEGANSI